MNSKLVITIFGYPDDLLLEDNGLKIFTVTIFDNLKIFYGLSIMKSYIFDISL